MPKITFISDTHNQHNKIKIPKSDILIHAGDATGRGNIQEVTSFLNWFAQQPATHKIYVAGNHDFLFEKDPHFAKVLLSEHPSIIYLQDSLVKVMDLNIYGSPHQPLFHNWAFNRNEDELKDLWSKIPDKVDILVTHGPPLDILDETEDGDKVGCKWLRQTVLERVKPKIHHFGHIHECYGTLQIDNTTFVNSSICNVIYRPDNKPITLEI